MDKENKIQELQILEQNLQNLLMQKQAFEMELAETKSAIKEIEKSGEDIFKIIGQLMIKSNKKEINEELINKEKLIDLRIKSLEKQEKTINEKFEELKGTINSKE